MDELKPLGPRVKKFQKAYKFFLVAQIFFMISSFEIVSRFKILSIIFSLLGLFGAVAFILLFVALFRLRNYNRGFALSLVTFGILTAVVIIKDVCSYSTDDFYIIWGKALEWSEVPLRCIMYVYFFIGAHDFFTELNIAKNSPKNKIATFSFIGLFVIERVLAFLLFFDAIKLDIVANRVCTYGKMAMTVITYIYILVITIIIAAIVNKRGKEISLDEKTE